MRFPRQPAGDAAGELIEVVFADGSPERMRIHEYGRVYAVPGLYEEVVQRRLGCRTPARTADMLADAAARIGVAAGDVRVLDLGAGNGVSGEALAARGLVPVVGIDLLPAARDAAGRDRPGLYGTYLAADVTALGPEEASLVRAARPNAVACVGSVGRGHVPAAAVAAALALCEREPLLAYGFDPDLGPDPLGDLIAGADELAREQWVHRRTVTGGERMWECAVVRPAPTGGSRGG